MRMIVNFCSTNNLFMYLLTIEGEAELGVFEYSKEKYQMDYLSSNNDNEFFNI